MADAPKRRGWCRFSLRTFLLAFTVVAVCLGWNVWQITKRIAAAVYISAQVATPSNRPRHTITYGEPRRPWNSLPLTWRILGVKPVASMELHGLPLSEREKLQGLFPEAEIRIIVATGE